MTKPKRIHTVTTGPGGMKIHEWFENDLLHRENGPAVVYEGGAKYWLIRGKMHREDGPAFIGADGRRAWYKNGQKHREDGPAYIPIEEPPEYWYRDQHIKAQNLEEFKQEVLLMKIAEVQDS